MKSKEIPKWGRGLAWKSVILLGFLKVAGITFEVPALAAIPIWSWNPFVLSVFFLYVWSVWLIGGGQIILIVVLRLAHKLGLEVDSVKPK